MSNPKLTHLVFLLDRSGSMQSIASDIIGGFEAFVDLQRGDEGLCTVTLAQFDNEYEVVYRGIAVGQVPPLALCPRGRTALYDSMGKLITDTAAEINALPEDDKPGTVVVAIMTDGMENAAANGGSQISKPLWSNKLTTTGGNSCTWVPIRMPSRWAGAWVSRTDSPSPTPGVSPANAADGVRERPRLPERQDG